jgi:hypothetical protein
VNPREQASPHGSSRNPRIRNADRNRPRAGQTHGAPEAGIEPVAALNSLRTSPQATVREYGNVRRIPGRHGPIPGRHGPSRLAGLVSMTVGLGLCGEGIAIAIAPRHPAVGQLLFFVALVVPFTILLTVLMVPWLGSLRRTTVVLLGMYPAVVYRMSSPLVLAGFDEHLHEQTLLNLLRGSGLFAPNPILPISPYYPGMEIITGVMIRLTGLPVILAMSIIVLLCRMLLILILYNGALTLSPSRRGASLVVAFYAVSPQFYLFNSLFAYQTLALTLGLGGLFLLRLAQRADHTSVRRLWGSASLVLMATVITHHLTSFMVLGFLIAWALCSPKSDRKLIVRAAIVMAISVTAWTAIVGRRAVEYLLPIFTSRLQIAKTFLSGTMTRQIFSASEGTAAIAGWERAVLIFYTLSCTVAALVCACIILSRAIYYRDRMLALLGILTLAYPSTLAAHFDPSVGALGDRASTFFFLPFALSCSLVIQRHPRVVRPLVHRRYPFRPAVAITLIGISAAVFLGGSLLGSSPDWQRLPGSYLVSAEARTQDPETLAAVQWAAAHLPPGSRVVADRVPADLLASQARLWPVQPERGLVPAHLYFSEVWGPQQVAIVKGLHIGYLYVDTRLAQSLPHVGFYFSEGETAKPTRISIGDVSKFAHVRGLTALYHHGPVTIYGTSGLGVKLTRTGFLGYHSMGLGAFDVVAGAVVACLILIFRPRLRWVRPTLQSLGGPGATLTIMAVVIFVGGTLFALRLMPGSLFTIGVVEATAVILVTERVRNHQRIFPLSANRRKLDPLVLLGTVFGIAGLLVAVHAAWITDVVDVNTIIRTVAGS